MKFWDTNYAKLNTEAIFGNVDKNKDGEIQEEEWIYFWEHVKGTGYSDEEIMEEVNIYIYIYIYTNYSSLLGVISSLHYQAICVLYENI